VADSGRTDFLIPPSECTVLIAAVNLLPLFKELSLEADTELLAFAETDVLRALDAISRRRPRLVVLEKGFAATPRGASLLTRIKADPALTQLEIRVISHEAQGEPDAAPAAALAAASVAAPLDFRGTRRATRYKMAEAVEANVAGNTATVIDLSTIGAQVVSATILKPNQRVRVIFSDAEGQVRCQAVVVWARFELPRGSGPRYCAGLQLLDANAEAIDAFRVRHQSL
jgi:hypothetical protein